MSLEEIARVVDGSLAGAGGSAPSGYSIDTRTLRKGDLFFAIVGQNQDGHKFLAEAAAKGAVAAVISQGAHGAQLPVIVVKDTLRALQDLAGFVRRKLPAKVVAITGSSGKTTTKEMTRHALEAAFQVHASRGNLNNLFGCPLSLLELDPTHQVSVLEMGMSYHGELARLAEIADPDIGVLTNVSGAHLAHFTSVDDVAAAKGELFAGMRQNTIGIFNTDDERCRRIQDSFRGYGFTFGIERPADLTAADYRMEGLEGSSFTVMHVHNGVSRSVQVRSQFVGVHHVYNALAALSVGYMLGISLEAMTERLSALAPLRMRGRLLRLKSSVRVLDDSYNANPAAVVFALGVLKEAELPAEGRKVLVLGDMLELGEGQEEAHAEIGRSIAAAGCDIVVGVGPLTAYALEALSKSAPRSGAKIETLHFNDSDKAAGRVAALARPGDLFLVKGSRGMALEKIVTALKERFGEE